MQECTIGHQNTDAKTVTVSTSMTAELAPVYVLSYIAS